MRRAGLAVACALDVAIGDPAWLPHPVQFAGAIVAFVDRKRSAAASPRAAFALGGALTATLVALAYGIGRRADRAPLSIRSVVAASTLAMRSLDDAVRSVDEALAARDFAAARTRVARVVGRDTAHLDESGIARAALETLAESLGDGVVAPLLALRLGGCAAALAFKAISTLDSMIGHAEPPYTFFGRVAARADDVANLVPARLAAVAVAVAATICGANGLAAVRVAFADAPRHRSPNAGWPEAALAGALGVRLGGDNHYDGVPSPGAVFNACARPAAAKDLARGLRIVRLAAALSAIAVCAS